MFTDEEAAYLRKLALTLQIVVGALAFSVILFAVIVTTILPPPAAMPAGWPYPGAVRKPARRTG